MFADALLDSHHHSRRGWATLTSFGIQAIFVACLLVLPLFYTQVLPQMRTSETFTMPLAPAPIIHAEPIEHSGGEISENPVAGPTIQVPIEIPNHIAHSGDGDSSNPPQVFGDGSHLGIGGGNPEIGVIGSFGTGRPPVLQEQVKPRDLRISVMMEGSLIHRVEPIYPSMARNVRIQGNVLLAAVIGKDGTVQNLQVVSGHPMLVRAALDAVRQWRYRPYALNG